MRAPAMRLAAVILVLGILLGGAFGQIALATGSRDPSGPPARTTEELLAAAQAALAQGNPEAALPLAQQAVAQAPADPETHYHLGLAYQAVARESEAEQAFGKAARLKPSVSRYHYALGLAYRQTGKENLALAAFLQVLRLEPAHPAAHYQIGDLLADQGSGESALKHWEAAVEASPAFTPALKALGQYYYGQSQLDRAVSYWERAAESDAYDADVWWRLATALAERKQGDDLVDAVWAFHQFRVLAPPSTEVSLLERADRALASNADKAARRYVARGIEALDDSPARAAVYFRRALDLRPGFAEGYYNLGLALQRLGKDDEAVAAYLQAAAFAPDQAPIHENLGLAYLSLKRPFQAEKELRKALSLAPGDRSIRLNLAVAVWQQGSAAEGRAALQALINEDPAFASAHYNLACLEAAAGRRTESLAALKRAIALDARYRETARKDADFAGLAQDPEFAALVGGP